MKPRRLLRRSLRAIRTGARRITSQIGRPGPAATRAADEPTAKVLVVGGTGRSGSSITALLLGAHRAYAHIPIETKFLASRGGLCDLVTGDATLDTFEAQLRGRWFNTKSGGGMHLMMDEGALDAALPILRRDLRGDPMSAARRFTHALFDPVANAAGAPGWVAKFPSTVRRADVLLEIFPNMHLVHVVRDGRDVACSVTTFGWGAPDPDSGLDWWHRRVERGFAACERIPESRVLVVQMEDLVARHRDREYSRLLGFLGLDDDPAMRTYFEERVTAARSHMGRWRQDVPPDQLPAFEAHHQRLADDLRARGRPYAPLAPQEALAVAG